MSHALEDEYCAASENALVFGSFQRARFFRQAEGRWRAIAGLAELVLVFADFERKRALAGRPVEVPIDHSDPLSREWAVICDGDAYSACICGWELPGQAAVSQRKRRFEVMWSVEPDVVRSASRIAWELAVEADGGLSKRMPARLRQPALPAGEGLRTASRVTNRMIAYLGWTTA
jgi:DICT domain-containing protein